MPVLAIKAEMPRLDADLVARLQETNVIGTANTLAPVIERMCARGSGHIVAISSIAALLNVPRLAAYSASKAALKPNDGRALGRIASAGDRCHPRSALVSYRQIC